MLFEIWGRSDFSLSSFYDQCLESQKKINFATSIISKWKLSKIMTAEYFEKKELYLHEVNDSFIYSPPRITHHI